MKANTMVMAMAILLMATGSLGLGLAACGGGDIPDDVEWEVKDHEKFTALGVTKVSIRVTLNRKVKEAVLQTIANKLRAGGAGIVITSRNELTVWFYPPGSDWRGAAWATVFYNDPTYGDRVLVSH